MIRQIAMAAAIVFCFLIPLRADPPTKGVGNANRPAPIDPIGATEKPGRLSSLKLVHDQSVIQCLEIIRQSIERKEFLGVLPLIDQVLIDPNSFFPTSNSTEVSTHEEVWRLLKQMPLEIRQRFDEQRRISAKIAWEQARIAGVAEVGGFLCRFSDTTLATDAWWWIACYERDHGRRFQAAAAFSKVAKHPKATEQQRAMALIASAESHHGEKLLREPVTARRQLSGMDPNRKVAFAGRSQSLGEWLNEHPNSKTFVDDKQTNSPFNVNEWRRNRPVLLPTWKQEFSLAQRTNLDTLEQKQRDQGISPIPLIRPMVVGQQVIVRTLDEIKAFDLNAGHPQWGIANTEFQQAGKRGFENKAFQTVVAEWAQRRTQADSIFGRMSTDGSRLFAVQEPDRSGEFRIDRESPRDRLRTGPRYNKLCCYRTETGLMEWEVGEAPVESGGVFSGVFFLGCPLVMDGQLYVVVQHDTELQLLVLEPEQGTIVWTMSLGTAPLPLEEDLQRSRIACPIVWADGLLLCSTSAGVVAAIDPLLRTMVWGYRYPAMTVSASDLVRLPGQTGSSLHHEPWWESWREPFADVVHLPDRELNRKQKTQAVDQAGDAVFIFTSPESEQLHAIQLPDGNPLWKVPRDGGLFVAGFADDMVVIVEGEAVRAHDLYSGQLRWRTVTTEVSGPAVLVGSVLVVPDRFGGATLLDANDGRVLSESSSSEPPLGGLVETERGWIAASRQAVMLLPRLEEVRRNVDQELARDPNNESFRVRAALLDLQ
ncbi:MAG: PQQ-binding-like beta-propeller repeat protein, partial [Schlesneria sp.]